MSPFNNATQYYLYSNLMYFYVRFFLFKGDQGTFFDLVALKQDALSVLNNNQTAPSDN